MSEKGKYTPIHYQQYLQLDKVLDAQDMRSEADGNPAHDEMLFIIIHQVYELWFKQILHEMESVASMFQDNLVDEREIGIAIHRMDRIISIQHLLIQQIHVLETMTALDFLDFRSYLYPASGFQSHQFRKVEVMLGLKQKQRHTYAGKNYQDEFAGKKRKELEDLESSPSLLQMVEKWLERTPFLEIGDFNFVEEYRKSVDRMHSKERDLIMESAFITDEDKANRIKGIEHTQKYFDTVLDEEVHKKSIEEGTAKLSYKATVAALLINLYREEPILRMPYELLTRLIDIDELFMAWRARHAQMVMRMLGRKMGTGGSSGHDYLKKTAEVHGIFTDLHNVSTLLIPRSELPVLPESLKENLGFYFSAKK